EEGTPAILLGYADVRTAATSKELKGNDPDQFVGITDGSFLPIKFRITDACDNANCGDGSIDTQQGGTVYYTEDGETKGGITIPPTTGGGVVTVDITPCTGNLPIPNPKFGSCLDVLVEEGGDEYEGIGVAFICDAEAAATAAGLSAARQELVTLYRKHGTDPVEALPHADDDCPEEVIPIGSVKGLFRALVHGNWKKAGQQLTSLLAPRPLYARRLDAGAGGTVDGGFSLFQFALPAALYGSAFTGTGGVTACSPPCPASLYSIDRGIGAGAATLIGPIGFNRVGAMDFHPTTGVLYATGQRPADNTPVLITINVITGAGTEVGPTGTTGVVADLSFRSDGTLFLYDANPPQHRLYTVNLATGAAILKGPTGLNNTGGNGIGFDAADVLYHSTVDASRTLDQTTGAASAPVATMSFPVGCSGGRVAATDRIEAIDVFYGAIKCTGGDQLGTVNYTTGAVTSIGPTVSGLDGLAFGAGSCDDCVILTSAFKVAAIPNVRVLPPAKTARRPTQ
ncbi:MAG TPA: hypothetical protein VJ817_15900, partial [Gemmatimonadales bacterium]|nr:hypothetical protein [Gemmatimonadales bacterium]